jgi:hypothetical protein
MDVFGATNIVSFMLYSYDNIHQDFVMEGVELIARLPESKAWDDYHT